MPIVIPVPLAQPSDSFYDERDLLRALGLRPVDKRPGCRAGLLDRHHNCYSGEHRTCTGGLRSTSGHIILDHPVAYWRPDDKRRGLLVSNYEFDHYQPHHLVDAELAAMGLATVIVGPSPYGRRGTPGGRPAGATARLVEAFPA